MHATQQAATLSAGERSWPESPSGALSTVFTEGESLAGVAHDARNLVTALGLYCDLLQEPGVLSDRYLHYAKELRLLATTSRRLVDKLTILDSSPDTLPSGGYFTPPSDRWATAGEPTSRARSAAWREQLTQVPVENFATELLAIRSLLAAIAGPSIQVNALTRGGARPVQLTGEDLTRILVNLIKNAAEAMPSGGSIDLALRELPSCDGKPAMLSLEVKDSGSGITEDIFEQVFEAGFSTRSHTADDLTGQHAHRGLGLSITRSIVEAAGGRIQAVRNQGGGACFHLELPVRSS